MCSAELNLFVGQLTPRQKANKSVQHAFAVQRAQAMGNYVKLCELYNDAPFMGAYIMDHFIDRERMKAMMVITKACVPLPLSRHESRLMLQVFIVDAVTEQYPSTP